MAGFKVKNGRGVLNFKQSDLTTHLAVASRGFAGRGFNGWLPNPDPILKKLGRDIEIYRDLKVDPIVGGHLRRRKSAVASMEYRLKRENIDDTVAQTIETMLADLDVYQFINDILECTELGYQPIEILWNPDTWLPKALIAKPQEWFKFNTDNELCFIGEKAQPEPVPEMKFLCPTQNASYTNPYGQGDLALIYWSATFLRGGKKFWVTFTEKYGTPWIIGKEPRANQPADTQKLLDSLEALAGDAVGTIPNDSSVEIIEASGKASSVDAFDKLVRYCRSEIAIALLGQDMSTEKDTNHASASAGLEVSNDIRDLHCRIVEGCINQLIDWVCTLNFGDDVVRPKFELYEEEAVDKVLAERDKTLTECGVTFTKAYFMRAYNLEDGDLLDVPPPDNGNSEIRRQRRISADAASFSEGTPYRDLSDDLAAGMPSAEALNAQTDAMLRGLIERLQNVANDQEALAILAQTYPEMDSEALQNELTKMLFIGQVLSRLETEGELE